MHWEAPLKLNLGCGENAKPGWINVDLFKTSCRIWLDIREPLPFPDGSVAMVYTSTSSSTSPTRPRTTRWAGRSRG